ncbi:MAG TPA: alpha/beta fold hydrolase [Oculatellaceae cyanobacterium]
MCALSGDAADVADRFAQLFTHQQFAEATKLFDKAVAAGLPSEKLAGLWKTLEQQGGGFKRVVPEHRIENRPQGKITFIPIEFERAILDLKIITSASNQISGLWIEPHSTASSASANQYTKPDYVDPRLFSESKAKITGNGPELDGLWTIPTGTGPFPAVILVHGSGPNDKNETVGSIKPFKDLADGLATRGIAALRYEKRTLQYPVSAIPEKFTVQDETINDAIAAMKVAASTAKIDPHRVFLLGHSLGGRMAPRIASQYAQVAGVIILAGDTRPFEDVLMEQLEYLSAGAKDSEPYTQMKERIAHLKDPSLSEKTPANQLPFGVPANYWLDFRSYDPVAVAKTLDKPMLILQGGRDYQVTADGDFAGWKKGLETNKKCTFKLYPALNHLFVAGTGKSHPYEYDRTGHVSKETVEDIAQWIRSH